jgi:hypothetical protein
MAGINTYLSILILNVNVLNSSIEDTIWQTGLLRKTQKSAVYKRHTLFIETNTGLG